MASSVPSTVENAEQATKPDSDRESDAGIAWAKLTAFELARKEHDSGMFPRAHGCRIRNPKIDQAYSEGNDLKGSLNGQENKPGHIAATPQNQLLQDNPRFMETAGEEPPNVQPAYTDKKKSRGQDVDISKRGHLSVRQPKPSKAKPLNCRKCHWKEKRKQIRAYQPALPNIEEEEEGVALAPVNGGLQYQHAAQNNCETEPSSVWTCTPRDDVIMHASGSNYYKTESDDTVSAAHSQAAAVDPSTLENMGPIDDYWPDISDGEGDSICPKPNADAIEARHEFTDVRGSLRLLEFQFKRPASETSLVFRDDILVLIACEKSLQFLHDVLWRMIEKGLRIKAVSDPVNVAGGVPKSAAKADTVLVRPEPSHSKTKKKKKQKKGQW